MYLSKTKCVLILGVFIMTLMLAGTAGAAEVTRLPNGLTVLIKQDDRFPLAALRLYVHAGSAYENPAQAGLSHLLEHMVFKSTENRPKGTAADDVESAGGYLNAATSIDYTYYVIDVPASNWKLGLDVMKDMIFGAKLDPKELEQEKKVVISEQDMRQDNPDARLFDMIQPLVFRGTPYEIGIAGDAKTVGAISREDIQKYIADHYQPGNMLLAIGGQIDPAAVMAEVERLFGNMKNTTPLPVQEPLPLPRTGDGPVVKLEKGQWNKVYLNLAFPIPGQTSPDMPALEMLSEVLGGGESSRFYRLFKYDLKLVDTISVGLMDLDRIGALCIQATLPAENVPKFWSRLMKEMAGLRTVKYNSQELERARTILEDQVYRKRETLTGLITNLGYDQFFFGSVRAEEQFLNSIAATDAKTLNSLAERFLKPELMNAALLAPDGTNISAEELTASAKKAWPDLAAAPDKTAQVASMVSAPEIIDLGQGRTLALIRDLNMPYVSVDIYYRGGDALLAPDQQGLASLTARTMTKGAGARSATQIQDFLSERASYIGAAATREFFSVSARYPSRFGQDIQKLLLEVLSKPTFAAAEVDREKQSQIAAIKALQDRPIALMLRDVFPFLFPEGYYGYVTLGQEEAVKAFKQRDIQAFWTKQRQGPWTMAVAGSFDPDEMKKLAQDIAKLVPAGQPTPFAEPVWGETHAAEIKLPERNQSHLLVVFPAPASSDPDAAGINLLNSMLSRQSGLLFKDLRDAKNLGYSVTSLLWQTPAAGFIAFYIGTTPDKVEEARAAFKNIVANLRETMPSDEELKRAANLMVGEYYRDHQSLGSRSSEAASLLAQGYDINHNQAMFEKAAKLTRSDMGEIVRKYLNWDQAYFMLVMP